MRFYICMLIYLIVCASCSKEEAYKSAQIKTSIDYEDTSIPLFYTTTNDTIHIVIETNWGKHVVVEYNPFPQSPLLKPVVRIPSVILTKNHTLLVACENRQENEDKGEIDILVARKEETDESFEIKNIFKYDNVSGRSMNPAFVVDETGRIYLFTCHLKDNAKFAVYQSTAEVDFVYKYSDDDGKTWSHEISLKELWDTSNYTAVIPSPASGITLCDGSLLVPTMIIKDGAWYSGLLTCINGRWKFTQPTDTIYGDNECTVYQDNDNRIIIDCRTYNTERHRYNYAIGSEKYEKDNNYVRDTKVAVSTHIVKDIENNMLIMSFPDSKDNKRENMSLFVSDDGLQWHKVYRIMEGASNGYSAIACDNNHLFVCVETVGGILVQDVSELKKIVSKFKE